MLIALYDQADICNQSTIDLFCLQLSLPIRVVLPIPANIYTLIKDINPFFTILFGAKTIKTILPSLKHIPQKMGWLVQYQDLLFYLCADPTTVQKTNQTLGVLKGHIKRLNTIIIPK